MEPLGSLVGFINGRGQKSGVQKDELRKTCRLVGYDRCMAPPCWLSRTFRSAIPPMITKARPSLLSKWIHTGATEHWTHSCVSSSAIWSKSSIFNVANLKLWPRPANCFSRHAKGVTRALKGEHLQQVCIRRPWHEHKTSLAILQDFCVEQVALSLSTGNLWKAAQWKAWFSSGDQRQARPANLAARFLCRVRRPETETGDCEGAAIE